MNKSLEIVFFPGFYGSIFDPVDNEYSSLKYEIEYYEDTYNKKFTMDDFIFDEDAWKNKICNLFTEGFSDMYKPHFIKSIVFDEMTSPRFYNFDNDRIYAFFEFTDDWKDHIKNFMDSNYKELKDIIKEEHSSRSGYISFMSNDIDEWYKKFFETTDEDDIETTYLEEIIKYYVLWDNGYAFNEGFKIREELESYVFENMNESEFFHLKEQFMSELA